MKYSVTHFSVHKKNNKFTNVRVNMVSVGDGLFFQINYDSPRPNHGLTTNFRGSENLMIWQDGICLEIGFHPETSSEKKLFDNSFTNVLQSDYCDTQVVFTPGLTFDWDIKRTTLKRIHKPKH